MIEASQNAMGTQEVNSPSRSAMQTNRGSTLAGHGLNLFNQFVMPWMGDFKKQHEKKRLLREIKSATIEKLTNKIIRSFAMEAALITPFLLLICLQYRQAALTDPTASCYGNLAIWLLTYFAGFGFFSVLRVLRVPVLRGLTHSFYFNYTLLITLMQIVFFAVWFFYGNAVFMKSINPSQECDAVYEDAAIAGQQRFNPKVM